MKLYMVYFLAIILMTGSCKEYPGINDLNDLTKIIVDELPDNDVYFFDIIEEYSHIILESNEKMLIGEISKIIFTNDRILLLDRIGKAVYAYNLEGTFLKEIGSIGRGPNEWISPQDIAFDEITQSIIVYCNSTRKLFYFSVDGESQAEVNLGLTFRSMEFLNEDTIFVFAQSIYNTLANNYELTYDLIAFNSDLEVLHTQFANNSELNVGITVMTHNKNFCNTGSDIFLSWLFNDTVYIIKPNSLEAMPFLCLDFGAKKVDNQILSSYSNFEIFHRIVEDKNRAIIRPVHVANNQMLIEFAAGIDLENPSDNYKILYNIETGVIKKFKSFLFEDDKCKWKNPIGVKGNYFVNVFSFADLKYIYGNSIPHHEVETENSEHQDPVLLLYKFKN